MVLGGVGQRKPRTVPARKLKNFADRRVPTPERHQETVVVAEGLPFYTKPIRKSFKMPATAWASS